MSLIIGQKDAQYNKLKICNKVIKLAKITIIILLVLIYFNTYLTKSMYSEYITIVLIILQEIDPKYTYKELILETFKLSTKVSKK